MCVKRNNSGFLIMFVRRDIEILDDAFSKTN
jgi:hypothetical protein